VVGTFLTLAFYLRVTSARPALLPKKKKASAVNWEKHAVTVSVVLFCASALYVAVNPPKVVGGQEPLRPRESAAYKTMQLVQEQVGGNQDPIWLVASARTWTELAGKYRLPTPFLPNEEILKTNNARLQAASRQLPAIRAAAESVGFSPASLQLTERVLKRWESVPNEMRWPSNKVSNFLLGRMIGESSSGLHGAGFMQFTSSPTELVTLQRELARSGVLLGSWGRLAESVLVQMKRDLWVVLIPILVLVAISIWVTLKEVTELALACVAVLFAAVVSLALMSLLQWNFNLMNLMGLPLFLGAGVDYSIHTIAAMRRHHGNLNMARRTTGKALWLCGITTIAGFGSNAWASNAGIASLGKMVALWISVMLLCSNLLLPYWWRAVHSRKVQFAETPEG
jgi:predicted exporter